MIVGVLSVIGTMIRLGNACVKTAKTGNSAPAIVAACSTTLFICAFILLVVGLRKKIAYFLIMQLVVDVISMIGFLASAIIFIVALARPQPISYDEEGNAKSDVASPLQPGIGLTVSLVAIVLQTWFFVIVLRAYQYLKLQMLHATAMQLPMEPAVIYSNGDDDTSSPPDYAHCVVEQQKEPLREA